MADKKISGNSVDIVWTDGEQLVANKLNAYSAILSRVSSELEKAVGDVWGESYPYSDASSTKLTLEYGRKLNDAGSLPGAEESYLDIANIARLIGPASALNPIELSNYGPEGASARYTTEILDEQLPTAGAAKREFVLNYNPYDTTAVTVAGSFDPAVYFVNQKTTHDDVNASGDWCVTANGRLTTFHALPTADSYYVTYETSPVEWGGGPAVQGSTYNVIPDINQAATGSGCTATAIDDYYTIALPIITHGKINQAETSTALDDNDASYLEQLYLPVVLQESFTVGDTIPEGFLYLRNNETGKVYSDATYVYSNESSFYIKNVELDVSATYTTFTVGSTITENIHDIRWKLNNHTHDGSYGEPPVHVEDIAGILEHDPEKGQYVESRMPGNWMPQYLHRDGYDSTEVNINDKNAMRGHLVLGLENSENDPGDYVNGEVVFEDDLDSYAIHFGGKPSTTATRNFYGPIIKAEDGALLVQSSRTASSTFNKAGSVEVTGSSNVIISAGQKTWIDTDTTLPTNTVIPGLTGDARLNLGCTGNINVGSTVGDINLTADDGDCNLTAGDRVRILSTGAHDQASKADHSPDTTSVMIDVTSVGDYKGGNITLAAGGSRPDLGEGVHIDGDTHGVGSVRLCTNWNRASSFTVSNGYSGNGANSTGVKILGTDNTSYGEDERPLLYVKGTRYTPDDAPVLAWMYHELDGNFFAGAGSDPGNPDVLYLSLDGVNGFTGRYDEWLQFRVENLTGSPTCGGVRRIDTGGASIERAALVIMEDSDGSGDGSDGNGFEHWDAGHLPQTTSYACQFYSNGADYGEWIQCGNPSEWADLFEGELEALLEKKCDHQKSHRIFGLPEGIVVYVRDDKPYGKDEEAYAQFYRKGPGIPMVISNHALVVGNAPKLEAGKIAIGEVISFMGQLPVIVKGPSKMGDLLMPSETDLNFCVAVSPESLTIAQYTKAIGTVLGNSSEEIKSNQFDKVLAAIGKK